jgi:hypothetical protein
MRPVASLEAMLRVHPFRRGGTCRAGPGDDDDDDDDTPIGDPPDDDEGDFDDDDDDDDDEDPLQVAGRVAIGRIL